MISSRIDIYSFFFFFFFLFFINYNIWVVKIQRIYSKFWKTTYVFDFLPKSKNFILGLSKFKFFSSHHFRIVSKKSILNLQEKLYWPFSSSRYRVVVTIWIRYLIRNIQFVRLQAQNRQKIREKKIIFITRQFCNQTTRRNEFKCDLIEFE